MRWGRTLSRGITRRDFGFTVLRAAGAGLAARGIGRASDPDFTLALIPDTQYLAYLCSPAFSNMMTWIANNRVASQGGVFTTNIMAAIGVGDCTHTSSAGEFSKSAAAYQVLDRAGVPWVNPPGNHDYVNGGTSADHSAIGAGYQNPGGYFGSAMRQAAYGSGVELPGGGSANWVGAYDSANYAVRYAIGSRRLLVFSVEFLPRMAVLAWARDLHDGHPDHECIITTHSFLSDAGSFMHFSSEATSIGYDNDSSNYGLNPGIIASNEEFQSGHAMWNRHIGSWSNLTLVVCGHSIYQKWHANGSWFFQQKALSSSSARGQTVQSIFANWQEMDAGNYGIDLAGGGGNVGPTTFCPSWPSNASGARIAHVMLLHFRPSEGKMEGYALSTNTGLWEPTWANRNTTPASTPQLLFSVDYVGVPEGHLRQRLTRPIWPPRGK